MGIPIVNLFYRVKRKVIRMTYHLLRDHMENLLHKPSDDRRFIQGIYKYSDLDVDVCEGHLSVMTGLNDICDELMLESNFNRLRSTYEIVADQTHRKIMDRFSDHNFDLLGSGFFATAYNSDVLGYQGFKYETPETIYAEDHLHEMRLTFNNVVDLIDDQHIATIRILRNIEVNDPQYEPIDWHKDWKSGFRWNSRDWYSRVRFGNISGVDPKMPWELSRLQHLVPLVLDGRMREGSDSKKYLECQTQILDWIAGNPYRYGINWTNAMEVSIRAVNIIWAWMLIPSLHRSPSLHWIINRSLYEHAKYIEANLDYYKERTNNHYLAEIIGLLYISLACPEFKESSKWMSFALKELANEMQRTIYPDGVNYESSSSYHCLVTELFLHGLHLFNRLNVQHERLAKRVVPTNTSTVLGDRQMDKYPKISIPKCYTEKLKKAVTYIADIRKPTGLIPQWGDADSGRLLKIPNLEIDTDRNFLRISAQIDPLNFDDLIAIGSLVLEFPYVKKYSDTHNFHNVLFSEYKGTFEDGETDDNSNVLTKDFTDQSHRYTKSYLNGGTCVIKEGRIWVSVIFSKVGLNGTGGHGHNDALALELNVDGKDFVVDWGTGIYIADSHLRNKFRCTSNHSTVSVLGMEQNPFSIEPKGLFRLREKANTTAIDIGDCTFLGEHFGFGTVHKRKVFVRPNNVWVEDTLDVVGKAFTNLTLAPDVNVVEANGSTWLVNGETKIRLAVLPPERCVTIEDGLFSPSYGRLQKTKKLVISRLTPCDSMEFIIE